MNRVGAARVVSAGDPREGAESRLRRVARTGGALRRAFAALAGRLVVRRSYEALGYARLGDYARERLGVSARTLQDLAAVDLQLARWPVLESELVSGHLPWSKVRLLARVARAGEIGDEQLLAEWVARARRTTARELERQVRAVERSGLAAAVRAAEPTAPDETDDVDDDTAVLRLPVPPDVAFKWHRVWRDAQRVAGARVSRAVVLEWLTAEVLAGLPAEAIEAGERSVAESEAEDPPSRHGRDDRSELAEAAGPPHAGDQPVVVAPFVRELVAGLAQLDPFELDARLRRAVRLEQRRDAEIASLLRVVRSGEFEWSGARPSLEACAREWLGMSPRKARALLRIERVGDRCPALREAFRDGVVSWAQAQQLARLVRPGDGENAHLDRWLAWARTVSVRRLEDTVAAALALGLASCDPESIAEAESEALAGSESGRQTCAHGTAEQRASDPWHITLRAPRELMRWFSATLCSVRLVLERAHGRPVGAGEGFEAMLDEALRSWQLQDPWLQRLSRRARSVYDRDGWRCTVPGCTSRRNLQRHHIVFRSAGGSDEPANQTTLCAFHHLRGVHAGRIRIRGTAPDALRFELGVRADRAPLVTYEAGDRLVG